MSDHDSEYESCSTDSDPPKQHPLFAAMDAITASVAVARVTDPPQEAEAAAQSDTASLSAISTSITPQTTAETQADIKERMDREGKGKGWPLVSLRHFTIFTINAIKNGEMEEDVKKTSMAEKYKAYCHDHELVCSKVRTIQAFSLCIQLTRQR